MTSKGTAVAVALALSACVTPIALAEDDAPGIPEEVARAFLQAEAANYVRSWLNQHPPVPGASQFGNKFLFVVQLLIAADAYIKADTDKARFHAVMQGAAAYVAYSYSATPVVGIIVTIAVAAATIIEAGISAGYEADMLRIQREMIATAIRINELISRYGMARAQRVMTLVELNQRAIDMSLRADRHLSLECAQRPTTYERLGDCLHLLTLAVVNREQALRALEGLLALPDADLAMLTPPKDVPAAPTREQIDALGAEVRKKFQDPLKAAAVSLVQIKGIYESYSTAYRELGARFTFDDALEGEQRIAAVEEVRHRCLVERTRLGAAFSTLSLRIATLSHDLRAAISDAPRKSATGLASDVDNALVSYEQYRVGCAPSKGGSALHEQATLLRSMALSLIRA